MLLTLSRLSSLIHPANKQSQHSESSKPPQPCHFNPASPPPRRFTSQPTSHPTSPPLSSTPCHSQQDRYCHNQARPMLAPSTAPTEVDTPPGLPPPAGTCRPPDPPEAVQPPPLLPPPLPPQPRSQRPPQPMLRSPCGDPEACFLAPPSQDAPPRAVPTASTAKHQQCSHPSILPSHHPGMLAGVSVLPPRRGPLASHPPSFAGERCRRLPTPAGTPELPGDLRQPRTDPEPHSTATHSQTLPTTSRGSTAAVLRARKFWLHLVPVSVLPPCTLGTLSCLSNPPMGAHGPDAATASPAAVLFSAPQLS